MNSLSYVSKGSSVAAFGIGIFVALNAFTPLASAQSALLPDKADCQTVGAAGCQSAYCDPQSWTCQPAPSSANCQFDAFGSRVCSTLQPGPTASGPGLVQGPTAQGSSLVQGPTASGGQNVTLYNPLAAGTNLEQFIHDVLAVVIRVGAIVVIFMLIYLGYLFVTAEGEPAEISHARKALLYTVIGALILLGAQAIASGIQATVQAISQGH